MSIEGTKTIYDFLEEQVQLLLGHEEIERLSHIPGIIQKQPGREPLINQDELSYVKAYAAFAKSALEPHPEEYELFRYWARRAIAKAAKKISRNRRHELLHCLACSPNFEHRHLPSLMITLVEDDASR